MKSFNLIRNYKNQNLNLTVIQDDNYLETTNTLT